MANEASARGFVTKKLTQVEILERTIGPNWIPAYKLIQVNTPYGFLTLAASRRLREMTEPTHRSFDPTIEKKTINGLIHYRKLSAGTEVRIGSGLQPNNDLLLNPESGTLPKQMSLI